ncbi:MAG: hypothetical protein RR284_03590, partial [Ruthenibacterium sp.]
LSIHVHARSRLKLNREIILANRYLLHHSSDQVLIIFLNLLRLPSKELLHFSNSLFLSFSASVKSLPKYRSL